MTVIPAGRGFALMAWRHGQNTRFTFSTHSTEGALQRESCRFSLPALDLGKSMWQCLFDKKIPIFFYPVCSTAARAREREHGVRASGLRSFLVFALMKKGAKKRRNEPKERAAWGSDSKRYSGSQTQKPGTQRKQEMDLPLFWQRSGLPLGWGCSALLHVLLCTCDKVGVCVRYVKRTERGSGRGRDVRHGLRGLPSPSCSTAKEKRYEQHIKSTPTLPYQPVLDSIKATTLRSLNDIRSSSSARPLCVLRNSVPFGRPINGHSTVKLYRSFILERI
ncbi:uncharacterized protein BDZ83DRAFT_374701 [Colletotrichum acutatum]|uniref:Uncharacterized protein n=1 Tax=Glomerella acutata TaxID=27357 RepID=A0AAD8XNC7_GLOAC|nr:uncharacterized protein BDZ83DRAFT_374701 [Colletotrichum acutatum]KAK1730560.1 hypothetical protein BDZ83DRAFT_374701 [Colletotrichum acutatum]